MPWTQSWTTIFFWLQGRSVTCYIIYKVATKCSNIMWTLIWCLSNSNLLRKIWHWHFLWSSSCAAVPLRVRNKNVVHVQPCYNDAAHGDHQESAIVWKKVSCPSCFLYTFYRAAIALRTSRSTLWYAFRRIRILWAYHAMFVSRYSAR